ncbi:hypothetical protein ACOSQ4_032208 [Xanthoceras sorbifolium]
MQPEGFVFQDQEQKVCKLQRSIYRLKQASRSWNIRFDIAIKTYGFEQNTYNLKSPSSGRSKNQKKKIKKKVCKKIAGGQLLVQYVSTDSQTVDVFTKALPHVHFQFRHDKLNLAVSPSSSLKEHVRDWHQIVVEAVGSNKSKKKKVIMHVLKNRSSSGEHGHGRGISQRGGTSYRGRSRGRGSYSQSGYGRGSYSQTGYGIGKSNVQCFQCRKFGHYSSECTNKHENYANLAEASNDIIEEPTLLIVHNDSVEKNNVWYLDSGASNYMCRRKEYFVNLKEEIGGSVSLGDGSKLQVAGRGQIQIYQKDGKIRYISDVYYIPSMESNILSLGQLLEKGHIIHMEDNQLYLRNASGQLIAQSGKWHLRFGHLHFNGLRLLSSTGMVHGLPNIELSDRVCEVCMISKQSRCSSSISSYCSYSKSNISYCHNYCRVIIYSTIFFRINHTFS